MVNGMHVHVILVTLDDFVCLSLLSPLEPVDDSYPDRDLPAFLPPEGFSKFDKPSPYV